jgi:hypothetical protein
VCAFYSLAGSSLRRKREIHRSFRRRRFESEDAALLDVLRLLVMKSPDYDVISGEEISFQNTKSRVSVYPYGFFRILPPGIA